MALKELLTDLTQGLDSYPNHNTPSTTGGFNYGGSTSVFDSKVFNQRSMGYSDKFTSQDNPAPLIPQILPGVNEGPASSILFLEDSPDGFIRGGGTNSVIRTAVDSIRMNKFLLTPEGGAFVNTQTHLQTTNPMIQEGGKGGGALLGTLGQFIFGTDLGFGVGDNGTNRNFNINNILKQVQSNYLGVHYDRAGNKPVFEDEYKYFKQHGEGKRYDSDTVGSFSKSVGLEKGNRLLTLAQKFHSGIDAVSAKSRPSIMSLNPNNPLGIDLGGALDLWDDFTSGIDNLMSDPIGTLGGKYTGDNILYQYHGGPNSIYGAGDTILYRYDNTNFDSKGYWNTHVATNYNLYYHYHQQSSDGFPPLDIHQMLASTANSTLFGGLPIFGENGLFFSDNSGKLIGDNFEGTLEQFGRNTFGDNLVDLVTGQWQKPSWAQDAIINGEIDTEDPLSLTMNDISGVSNYHNNSISLGYYGTRWKTTGNNAVKNFLTGPVLTLTHLGKDSVLNLGPQTGYIASPMGNSNTPTATAEIRQYSNEYYVFSDLGGYFADHPYTNMPRGIASTLDESIKLGFSDLEGNFYESPDKNYFSSHILSSAYLGRMDISGPRSGYIKPNYHNYSRLTGNPNTLQFQSGVIGLSTEDRNDGIDYKQGTHPTDVFPTPIAKRHKENPEVVVDERTSKQIFKTDNNYRPSFANITKEGTKVFKNNDDHYLSRRTPKLFVNRLNTGDPGAKGNFMSTKSSWSAPTQSGKDKINAEDIHEVTGGDFSGEKYRDFCRFRFEVVHPSDINTVDAIVFRAFLENFDDNFSANWNSHKYNGRAEEFYTYNSFKRQYSFSFKIAAQSRQEMKPLYRKLNYLASTLAPRYSGDTKRMQATYLRLTLGAYMDRTPGFLTSMNIKWSKDYPWEIAMGYKSEGRGGIQYTAAQDSKSFNNDSDMHVLPQVLDVSCQFTPIHDFTPQTSIECAPFIIPGEDSPLHSITGNNRKWLKGTPCYPKGGSNLRKIEKPTVRDKDRTDGDFGMMGSLGDNDQEDIITTSIKNFKGEDVSPFSTDGIIYTKSINEVKTRIIMPNSVGADPVITETTDKDGRTSYNFNLGIGAKY